jgi:TRAP transporter TAXI family solute receptor
MVYFMWFDIKKVSLVIAISMVVANVGFSDDMIIIGSGDTVGLYYATSSAVAKLFNNKSKDHHLWAVTASSEGSIDNINKVLDGTFQFGFAQENSLDKANRGLPPWEDSPHDNLRAVFGLYTEALTIVAAKDSKIFSLSDMKKKKVNIGEVGSGVHEMISNLIKNPDFELHNIKALAEHESHSSDLFINKKIDAYFFTVGHPDIAVKDTAAGKRKVRLIPLNQEEIKFIINANPHFSPTFIPIDYYTNIENSSPVPAVGVRAVFFTRADVSDTVVYSVVKEIMENFDLFKRQHPVFADLDAGEMARIKVIPLHAGALRYFREMGVLK